LHCEANCPRNKDGENPRPFALPHWGSGHFYSGEVDKDGSAIILPGKSRSRSTTPTRSSGPRTSTARRVAVDRHGQREVVIDCFVGTIPVEAAIVDTGAMQSCVQEAFYRKHHHHFGRIQREDASSVVIEGIDGVRLPCLGEVALPLTFVDSASHCNYTTPHAISLLIVRGLGSELLLGMNAMEEGTGISNIRTATGILEFGSGTIRSPYRPIRSPHATCIYRAVALERVVLQPLETRPVRVSFQQPGGEDDRTRGTPLLLEAAKLQGPNGPFQLGLSLAVCEWGGHHGDYCHLLPLTNPFSQPLVLRVGLPLVKGEVIEERAILPLSGPHGKEGKARRDPKAATMAEKLQWLGDEATHLADTLAEGFQEDIRCARVCLASATAPAGGMEM